MTFKQTKIASAVSTALLMLAAAPAFAADDQAQAPATQTSAPAKKDTVTVTGAEPVVVTVTGIRASLEQSLNVKRNSGANISVITAEDIGKMPDKNLADSLQRLPGVAVRTDYDEAEKVSMRGTNPDMALVLFNGHTVSSGDWYVADQQSSSRSTSLSLVPSSVLNQALVYKTSQANIVDGGLSGTVNVTTRKPLQAKERLSGTIEGGGVYSDLPGKFGPQFNASVNWKNESNTFGVLVQGFSEKRYMRRDSSSRLAYGTSSGWDVINTATMKGITDESLAGTGYKAADLNGVRMPGTMSLEFSEGVRDRKGGIFSMQFKPNADFDVTTTGFYSRMSGENYGRLQAGATYSMLLGKAEPLGGTAATSPNAVNAAGQQVFASIRNPVIVDETTVFGDHLRVLKAADIAYPAGTPPQYIGNTEGFFRQGAEGMGSFIDLDAKWRASRDLTFKGLFNLTRGVGKTDLDQGVTFARYGTGVSYRMGDVEDAPYVHYTGTGAPTVGLNPDGSGYKVVSAGASGVNTEDREKSLDLTGEYRLDLGPLTTTYFGTHWSEHSRFSHRFAPVVFAPTLTSPSAGTIPFPSDFGKFLNTPAGSDIDSITYTPEALKAYIATRFKYTGTEFDRRVAGEIEAVETQKAVFAMQDFEFDNLGLTGNFGLRWTSTRINAQIVTPIPSGVCPKYGPGQTPVPCAAYPTAINTAGDGNTLVDGVPFNPLQGTVYWKKPTDRTYNRLLPSLNLRWEPAKGMITRFGASRTIGRQNYNLLGAGFGSPSCTASGCQVTGPNPDLKPLISSNGDLSFEWYFAPRALAQLNFFVSSLSGLPKTGANPQGVFVDLIDPRDNTVKSFSVNTSSQQSGLIHGIEASFEMPVGGGFGFNANVSRAVTRMEDGRPLVGASEHAANLGGYYENDTWSARLVWNYRGAYVSSSTAPSPTANSQGLSVINGITMPAAPTFAKGVANVALTVNYNWSQNLMFSFSGTNLTNPTRAQYRYSEEEQQKLDASGRQYYMTARYKF
jgi:iron complex outermembrane receptor protein